MKNIKTILRRCLSIFCIAMLLSGCIVTQAKQPEDNSQKTAPISSNQKTTLNNYMNQLKSKKQHSTKREWVISDGASFDTVKTYKQLKSSLNADKNIIGFTVSSKGQVHSIDFTSVVTGTLYLLVASSENNVGTCRMTIIDNTLSETSNLKDLYPDYGSTWSLAMEKNHSYTLKFTDISNSTPDDVYAFVGCMIPYQTNRDLLSSYSDGNYSIACGKNVTTVKPTYWKKKISSKGRLTIWAKDCFFSNPQNVKVTLLNSSKKAVSPTITLNDQKAYFGVLGDRTYYVKVESPTPFYGIYCKTSSYSYSPGTKKSSAKTISKGSTKKSTLGASTSTSSHWYKFTLKKKSKLTINYTGYSAYGSSINITIYSKSGKKQISAKVSGKRNVAATKTISASNVPKGTYYIKVSKNSTKSSSAYSLTYK